MRIASVVVPVYNVAAYLDGCLASILAQTCEDIEVICVDDGSTDESGDLLDAWAARDARISVVHKKNGGLSSARNAGIECAQGTYLFLVDSDDELEPKAVETVVSVFQRTEADVVTFGANFLDGDPTPWLERCLSPRAVCFDHFSPKVLTDESATPFAWRTACRLDWLRAHGPRFDEVVRYGEDVVWHFSLYPAARTIALVPDRLYRYRLARAGSLMDAHDQGASERISDHVKVVERVFAAWSEQGYLERWGSELVSWSVDYVLYATLRQGPSAEREQSLRTLGELYRSHAQDFALPRAVRRLVNLVGDGRVDGREAKVASIRWRIWRYGLLDLVQTAFGLGGSVSGSHE